MNNSDDKLTIRDLFDWLLIALITGGGIYVMLTLAWFVYKLFVGTYHLLDKLIDKL